MSIWKIRKKYLLAQLTPKLLEIGFEPVGTSTLGSRTTATHVQFERHQENTFDSLTIIFDKYFRPKFQITFLKREALSPHKIVQSGNLVRRKRQLTSWWGIRWFSLSKEKAWRRSVEKARKRLGQVDVFLNSGVAGKNITDMAKYF
ncbi:hypothetical protein N9W89_11715 [Hellea sp.]|nr:hypothetical protein [Hellea sp.]